MPAEALSVPLTLAGLILGPGSLLAPVYIYIYIIMT